MVGDLAAVGVETVHECHGRHIEIPVKIVDIGDCTDKVPFKGVIFAATQLGKLVAGHYSHHVAMDGAQIIFQLKAFRQLPALKIHHIFIWLVWLYLHHL